MATKGMEIDPLDQLDKIVDYCVGNIPADDIGADEFSTLPESLSRLEHTPGDRNAVQAAIEYTGKLKSKIVFLEDELLRLQQLQKHGIIR